MRIASSLLALTMLGCSAGWAQQSEDGAAGTVTQENSGPLPDKEGVYRVGAGIVPPAMLTPEPPVFPAEVTTELATPLICMLSAVIGVDGTASRIQVVRGCNDVFSKAAIDSVSHSQYRPGTLSGKPVPVLTHVRVLFQDPLFANVPRLALRYREGPASDAPVRNGQDTPPKAIHMVEAEFSEQARRYGTDGVVLVSLTVDETGMPTDVHVVRVAGQGLDEQALKAVRQYRFQPATKDGKPVPATISVEVSFKLHTRLRP